MVGAVPVPTGWAILQLREQTESLRTAEIERDLRARWADVICRFPAVKQGQLDRDNPLSAYVFVQTPLSPKIEKSIYTSGLLRDPVTRKLQKVTDADLAEMVPTTPLPAPGTSVRVTVGDWSGLEAQVVERNCQTIKVLIELWSKTTILTLAPNEFQPT